MTAPGAPVLAVVEQAYRGGVESQYADVLYLCRELNRQLGLELILRGAAVTFAVRADPVPALRVADVDVVITDPRPTLSALLDEGARVGVDRADLDRLGLAHDRLIDRVELRDAPVATADWSLYRGVWFL